MKLLNSKSTDKKKSNPNNQKGSTSELPLGIKHAKPLKVN